MRQQMWLATVVCAVAVIPGYFLGALFKILMYVFGGWINGSDFLYLHALFGIEMPNIIYEWVFAHAIPSFIQAMIGGYFAVWVMEKLASGADYRSAALITGALYTGALICLTILTLLTAGPLVSDMLISIIECVGIWIGLNSAANELPLPRKVAAQNG
jgi:hypothetical protein